LVNQKTVRQGESGTQKKKKKQKKIFQEGGHKRAALRKIMVSGGQVLIGRKKYLSRTQGRGKGDIGGLGESKEPAIQVVA